MEFEEIAKTVRGLNEEMYEQCVCEEYVYLIFHSNGDSIRIEFLGVPIWSDDDDERGYNADTDKYEPLEDFLRREIHEMIKPLKKINLIT